MHTLRIVDFQRQPLAQVTSKPPDLLTLEFLSPENETDFQHTLTAFVDYCQHNGLPLRTSRQVQDGGHTIIVDEQIVVKPNDERFLQALGDAISCYTFGKESKRVFALMQGQ
jgi:hypothetical protein